jgi:hypothetical protein
MESQQWQDLIDGLVALPCPDPMLRIRLLKDALRVASDDLQGGGFRGTDFGSAKAAEHIREFHGGNHRATCSHRLLERAHPIGIGELARKLAAGETSAAEAMGLLGPLVLLTREEHRAAGDFGDVAALATHLGAPLIRWTETAGDR